MPNLKNANERGDRIESEIETVDAATKGRILGAWKESIIEDLIALLAVTSDVGTLGNIDRAIAVGRDIHEHENQRDPAARG